MTSFRVGALLSEKSALLHIFWQLLYDKVGQRYCVCGNWLVTQDQQVPDQVMKHCHARIYQSKSAVMYLMVRPIAPNLAGTTSVHTMLEASIGVTTKLKI